MARTHNQSLGRIVESIHHMLLICMLRGTSRQIKHSGLGLHVGVFVDDVYARHSSPAVRPQPSHKEQFLTSNLFIFC